MEKKVAIKRYRDPSPVDDGLVFMGYTNGGKEWWSSPQQLAKERERVKLQQRKYHKTEQWKCYKQEYSIRPDVVSRVQAYRKSEKAKNYQREYRKLPKAKAAAKEYTEKTIARRRELRRVSEKKRMQNPMHRIAKACRSRIADGIRRAKGSRFTKSCVLLGCSIQFLKNWIEAKWKSGMTWANWGTAWQIDHIKPVISFDLTTLAGQLQCFRFSNTQPLWKSENLSKPRKIGYAW